MPSTNKKYINIYFQVHQPRRLRHYQFFDIGSTASYFDDELNGSILKRIAHDCYLPANKLLLKLIKRNPKLKVTFSISGIVLEQLHRWAPEVLKSFRALAKTKSVEFLGETYFHSLSFLTDKEEFIAQIKQHKKILKQYLGASPTFFRNTELIYADAIGQAVYDLGFKGMYVDGVNNILKGKPPYALYQHPECDLILFPRNFALSDDIAFRYSDRNWTEWPLTSKKYIGWLKNISIAQNYVGLGMDYETFGEHQKAGDGILKFLEETLSRLSKLKSFEFVTPTDAAKLFSSKEIISSRKMVSWADEARDLSAWLGNDMQRDAFESLKKLHYEILETGDAAIISDYRYLQTSDHFYYMSTKKDNDGNVHQYFSPYNSPYEAFINYMNVLTDLELRVKCLSSLQQKTIQKKMSRSAKPKGKVIV